MGKKALLADIQTTVDQCNVDLDEAQDIDDGTLIDELTMEIETLGYVVKMVNKHIKE